LTPCDHSIYETAGLPKRFDFGNPAFYFMMCEYAEECTLPTVCSCNFIPSSGASPMNSSTAKATCSIFTLITIAFLMAACFALSGCGTANDQAPALSSSNTHPGDWRSAHRSAYRQNPASCTECHGTDLKGGITKIGCSTASCHAGEHGPRGIIHPVPYKGTIDLNKTHGSFAKKDLTICQDCHATPGSTGSNPRFNLPYETLPNGCETSGCHDQKKGQGHPIPWDTHGTSGNQANACTLCHGANFEGGSGRSCKSCHTRLMGVLLPTIGSCDSCHGNPPNGITRHNRAGSHATHLALPELASNCGACHKGAGSGSAIHAVFKNRSALISLSPAYSAKNGTVGYLLSTNTCTNVICHGGQTTPAWGGTIAASGCSSCHVSGTAQYNSYASGKHSKHLTERLACTDCHDIKTLKATSQHFSNVSSSTFNQSPASTIRASELNYTLLPKPSCTPTTVPTGSQVTVCHGGLTTVKQEW
jgi:predicted CxxxxCH...CXXCH cytochrome family protein